MKLKLIIKELIYKINNRFVLSLDIHKRNYYVGFNRWLFKRNSAEFGTQLKVYNQIYLKCYGEITIGNYFTFTSGDCINPICRNIRGCIYVMKNAKLIIGNHVGISSACIWVQNEITIGNNVNIGGNCLIIDNDAHPIDFIERRNPPTIENTKSEPIHIEDDVWIGANSTILKGVTIGSRSIIGAGSIVTKNIPPDCIAAGNPCKIVKYL